MKTTLATKTDHTKSWYVVDAANETLGRISVKIANVLRGRHKPTYTPHADTGDFVVVVNVQHQPRPALTFIINPDQKSTKCELTRR